MSTPNPAEVLADVVAAAVRTHERGGWDDVQIDALRTALFEYRDRAEAPATATELDRLRAEGAQLYSDLTGANLARWEEERDNARLRLALKSAQRGRATARAEFFGEQAQHRTTVEQRNEHVQELVRLRARVAELDAALGTARADAAGAAYRAEVIAARDEQIITWLEKKAREEGSSNKDSRVRATAIYRMADKLSRGAVRPPLSGAPAPAQESYPGELVMFRGLLGVLRAVAKHGDMAEVKRLLAEHEADELDARKDAS